METSWKDILMALALAIGMPTGFFLIRMGVRIRKASPEKYERYRQATLLCKKINSGVILSEEEKTDLDSCARSGVVSMDGKNKLILSDQHLDEIF